jgi:hypothetical protein
MDKKRPDEKFLSADKRKMIMKSKYFESCIKLDTRLRISYPNITSHDYFDSWHIANSLGFVWTAPQGLDTCVRIDGSLT